MSGILPCRNSSFPMNSTVGPGGVVVTGASSGIGAACAVHLADRGFRVFAGVRRIQDGETLRLRNPLIVPILLDVTDHRSIVLATQEVANSVGDGGLIGLVNNAGIAVGGPLEVLPLDDLRRQLEVNVVGQVAVTQAFLPLLRRGRGRIVNMGSIAGRATTPILGAYAMSKHALEAMTTAFRLELDRWGIDVSIIEPGAIATPIWEKSIEAADRLQSKIGEEAVALYADQLACVRRVVGDAERRAIPADAVAKAVAHALTARRPRTHYLVGADAKFRAFLVACLPDRVQDALLRWFLRYPKRR